MKSGCMCQLACHMHRRITLKPLLMQEGFQHTAPSSRILATWQADRHAVGPVYASLDLGPISPPARVLTQHRALMHQASLSPLTDVTNTPRLDSSSDSAILQVPSPASSLIFRLCQQLPPL